MEANHSESPLDKAPEAQNIIVLSDGTGNSAAQVWRTNVWRVYQSLDLRTLQQVAYYNDGVGTSTFRPLAMLGGASSIVTTQVRRLLRWSRSVNPP